MREGRWHVELPAPAARALPAMTDHEETMTVSTVTDASTVTNRDAPDISGCALTEGQQRLLATASESWGKAGGPVQYLKARYAGPK